MVADEMGSIEDYGLDEAFPGRAGQALVAVARRPDPPARESQPAPPVDEPAASARFRMARASKAAPRRPAAAPAPRPGLFGSEETRFENLDAFPRVSGAIAGSYSELRGETEACRTAARADCPAAAWSDFLAGLAGKGRQAQLEAVNRYVNSARYVGDRRNYGVANRWATAAQLFARGGDCEDYVVAKYVFLRALGFDAADLRIVVVQDRILRRAHAVLVAHVGGDAWVLDNRDRWPRRTTRIRYYRPIYSLNETGWWLHRPPLRMAAAPRPSGPDGALGG